MTAPQRLPCLQDDRTLPLELCDGYTLKTLKLEGAYLLAQQRAAEAFTRRVHQTKGKITLNRDEALELAHAFERVVSVASGYHLATCDKR
jgi:hypothetical protein